MKALRRTFPLALAGLATGSAHACTVCDSQNGHALRAGLFNGHFLHTLFITIAPMPLMVAAVALLHLLMPDLATGDEIAAPDLALPDAEPTA